MLKEKQQPLSRLRQTSLWRNHKKKAEMEEFFVVFISDISVFGARRLLLFTVGSTIFFVALVYVTDLNHNSKIKTIRTKHWVTLNLSLL